jgi:glycosyltransferase involved in cell wall biosynthesis
LIHEHSFTNQIHAHAHGDNDHEEPSRRACYASAHTRGAEPPPDRVIVVDASDDDGTAAAVRHFQAERSVFPVRFISSEPDICAQKNIGLDAAEADVVSFFDDDAVLEPDYCATVMRRFEEDATASIGAIGGLLTNPPRRSMLEILFRKLFLLQSDRGRHRFLASGFPDPGWDYTAETEVEFLASTALSLRRSCIDGLRFDEKHLTGKALSLGTGRAFSEDVLFTWTLGRNARLIVLPDARYTHNVSMSNRENRAVTQTLYVYSLRYVSALHAVSPLRSLARGWALFGLGVLSVLQSAACRDAGYLRGYRAAMSLPLSDNETITSI